MNQPVTILTDELRTARCELGVAINRIDNQIAKYRDILPTDAERRADTDRRELMGIRSILGDQLEALDRWMIGQGIHF